MTIEAGAALITGAATRIGRSLALDLAAVGWRVAIHYHHSEKAAKQLLQDTRAAGAPKAVALQADLSKVDATMDLVADACKFLEMKLTLLVNNASIFENDEIGSLRSDLWDKQMAVNLRAPALLTQEFANNAPSAVKDVNGELRAQACIVNLIDQRVWSLTPNYVSYTLAKSALWTFTRTSAQALAPHIRVMAIGPGRVLPAAGDSEAEFRRRRGQTPLQRGTNLEELNSALQYILASHSITGQMLALDGGKHLQWHSVKFDEQQKSAGENN